MRQRSRIDGRWLATTNTSSAERHEKLVLVRKEGSAHEAYGAFRAGFEVLEAVGKAPDDVFVEEEMQATENVVASQAMIEQLQERMVTHETVNAELKSEIAELKKKNAEMEARLARLEGEQAGALMTGGTNVGRHGRRLYDLRSSHLLHTRAPRA